MSESAICLALLGVRPQNPFCMVPHEKPKALGMKWEWGPSGPITALKSPTAPATVGGERARYATGESWEGRAKAATRKSGDQPCGPERGSIKTDWVFRGPMPNLGAIRDPPFTYEGET